MLSALGNKSIILLIEPVMAALFPEEQKLREEIEEEARRQLEERNEEPEAPDDSFIGKLTGLGDRFDIRGFHDAVLLGGAVPLPTLQQQIDRWIEAQTP